MVEEVEAVGPLQEPSFPPAQAMGEELLLMGESSIPRGLGEPRATTTAKMIFVISTSEE